MHEEQDMGGEVGWDHILFGENKCRSDTSGSVLNITDDGVYSI